MVLNIIATTLYYCLRILNFAVLLFCILSWIGRSNSKLFKIYNILGYYLWPVMGPARWIQNKLFARFNINIPIDFSPWLTMILAEFVYKIIIILLNLFFKVLF